MAVVLILGDQISHFKVVGPFPSPLEADNYLRDHGAVNDPPNQSWQCWQLEPPER